MVVKENPDGKKKRRRETDPYNSTMSGGLFSTKNFSGKFDKVNWPTFVNGLSYIAREISISFPPTGTNVKSKNAVELPSFTKSMLFLRSYSDKNFFRG